MKFGTSGLRGLVTEMTDAVCEAHAAAFVRHLRRAGLPVEAVLVGEDLRPSSPRIAAACRRAIRAEGATAVACGVVPTPALALEAARRGAPAIMVTGSHIPFDRNGLKFYRPDGEITKADEAGLARRPRRAGAGPPPRAPKNPAIGVAARYVARYVDFFGAGRLAGQPHRPLRPQRRRPRPDRRDARPPRRRGGRARPHRRLRADRHRGDLARGRDPDRAAGSPSTASTRWSRPTATATAR